MNNIIMKFVTCLVAYGLGLDLFFNATWIEVVSFSVLMTVISYFIGDRILLSRLGKKNALIADFFLSYLVVWIFGSVLLTGYMQIAWGSIISATIITVGEYFVHRSLLASNHGEARNRNRVSNRLAYSMEIAEEEEPLKKK